MDTNQPYLRRPRCILRLDNERIAMYPDDQGVPVMEIVFYGTNHTPPPRNIYRHAEGPAFHKWEKISGDHQLDPKAIIWQLVFVVLQAYRESEKLIELSGSQT